MFIAFIILIILTFLMLLYSLAILMGKDSDVYSMLSKEEKNLSEKRR